MWEIKLQTQKHKENKKQLWNKLIFSDQRLRSAVHSNKDGFKFSGVYWIFMFMAYHLIIAYCPILSKNKEENFKSIIHAVKYIFKSLKE